MKFQKLFFLRKSKENISKWVLLTKLSSVYMYGEIPNITDTKCMILSLALVSMIDDLYIKYFFFFFFLLFCFSGKKGKEKAELISVHPSQTTRFFLVQMIGQA